MASTQVLQGLWIGELASLADAEKLNVSAVLSVLNCPDDLEHPQASLPAQHLKLDVEDIPDANLLQLLPAAVKFIHSARTAGGSVLVHCAAGVSRSAAVVVAYLMATHHPALLPSQALSLLRQSHPAASPNAGFMEQLELYHAMGCRIDEGHVPYKRFLLERVGRRYEETGQLDAESLAQPSDRGDGQATLYRCRKCRSLVATADNVVEVEAGPGAAAFPWRKRDKQQRQVTAANGRGGTSPAPWEEEASPTPARDGAGAGGEGEGSLFMEPLRWMAGMVVGGPVQGKLYCPKCQARLGSFNWSGAQSSSGAWVVPAFQLHASRLDAIDPRPPAMLAHTLRQPRMLAASTPSPPHPVGAGHPSLPKLSPGEGQRAAGGAALAAAGTAAAGRADCGEGAGVKGERAGRGSGSRVFHCM